MERKPCPFCGSIKLLIQHQSEDREGFPVYIVCDDCGSQGPWIYTKDVRALTDLEYAM